MADRHKVVAFCLVRNLETYLEGQVILFSCLLTVFHGLMSEVVHNSDEVC